MYIGSRASTTFKYVEAERYNRQHHFHSVVVNSGTENFMQHFLTQVIVAGISEAAFGSTFFEDK